MKNILFVLFLVSLIAQNVFAKGEVTYPTFFSESIQKNSRIAVYLPEGYNPVESRHYAVIYFLHGAYTDYSPYISTLADALDEMIGNGQIQPLILVAPDGSGGNWGGTFWTNSVLYGLVEDYVTKDVVAYIDGAYLTMPLPEARAIIGFSDGGDGAMVTGLRHPDIYRSIAAHSGFYNWDLIRGDFRTWVLAESQGPPYNYIPNPGTATYDLYRLAGAYSPNLNNPPYYVDLPLDVDGNINEEVLNLWKAYNADVLASALLPESAPDIYFTCGTDDIVNYPGNLYFKNALDNMNISYTFVPFSGGHGLSKEDLLQIYSHIDGVIAKLTGIARNHASEISGLELHDNYPNPFNASTTMSYQLSQAGHVNLSIYNSIGQPVITLADERQESGRHTLVWDGRDQNGVAAASGVYVYSLKAGDFIEQKKMVVLK